jgi:hypothetical protein
MTGELWVALAGVLSGTVVGIAGVASGLHTARRASADARALAEDEREHTRQLAHDERVFAGRSRAYQETLRHLHRRWFFIERTHPIAGPTRPPPPPPTDDELLAVEALIGAFGSEPIRRAVYDFGTFAARFRHAASQYDVVLAQEHVEQQRAMLWETMDGHRNEALAKLREIEAMIQHELTGDEQRERR